jgi:carbamoyl-phosphate synthase large subunit
MPRRSDIKKVMIIGSGPIVIGQACEFDYSGTQACKALRRLGYEIVLANSNPATIMTDPGMADVTYIEPLNLATMTKIIKAERPDALLPNLGGQSGLNLSSELARAGVLDQYGVKVIGVEVDAIERGEDRLAFKETMNRLGLEMPRSEIALSVEEAERIADELGYPVVIRPAYTLGGWGGGLVYNLEELRTIAARSWSWGAAPTASARASSSTTAACTRPSPSGTKVSSPSWSTATRRPCPPITTLRTSSISSP